MTRKPEDILRELLQLPKEAEWVEFKINDSRPEEIGEYISALSNSAALHDKEKGYLVFGVEDETHKVIGTKFKPKKTKKGNEELENWLAHLLDPRIDFYIHEFSFRGSSVVIFVIDPAYDRPVKFKGRAYIRVGSYTKPLDEHPEKERKIWTIGEEEDWSAQICPDAILDDLDPDAIRKARDEYKKKNPGDALEVDTWNDIKFLNKAKFTIRGQITNAAILLLGQSESEVLLTPAVGRIFWLLRDHNNKDLDSEYFYPPFILTVDKALEKIRNHRVQFLPDGTLFPIELTQYDPWVIREALHNCIAHQDYRMRGRIILIEKPDELIFENSGSFLPGSIENVISADSPPPSYRNHLLTTAMHEVGMIETRGGGIKKMFESQKRRCFPLPDYELGDPQKVATRMSGIILNEKYTKLLMKRTDLELPTIILLDKVQRGKTISREECKHLRRIHLIEGRYPNIYLSSVLAFNGETRANYIKNKAIDKERYQDRILEYLNEFGSASREDIDRLIKNNLPEWMTDQQKENKIHNLLQSMSKEGLIANQGSSRKLPKWVRSSLE